MKFKILASTTLLAGLLNSLTVNAQMPTKYELTMTNASQMPLSPPVVYTKNGAESAAALGSSPTQGFIQLCQSGNTQNRTSELKSDATVSFVIQTNMMIMPGESRVVEIEVNNPQQQSIHFETMYGKTKDVCGIGSVTSHSLVALKQHVTTEIIQKDNTVLTDAFVDPVLPRGMTYLDPSVCPTTTSAIACLRELATMNAKKPQIRFFAGYSPSLITALETKFGSAEVQSLLFPISGAIQIKLKLKH